MDFICVVAHDTAIERFVAEWGLDEVARDALVRLDYYTQQKMMNAFSPEAFFGGVHYAFMHAVESVVDRRSRYNGFRRVFGGYYEVGGFIRWWQLDNKAANTLYVLDPATQARVMSWLSQRNLRLWTDLTLWIHRFFLVFAMFSFVSVRVYTQVGVYGPLLS